MTYKLKVKDGDSNYLWNEKKGDYAFTEVDFVDEFDTLVDALQHFLEWIGDKELETRVTLSFTPEAVQDKKKGKKGRK